MMTLLVTKMTQIIMTMAATVIIIITMEDERKTSRTSTMGEVGDVLYLSLDLGDGRHL